MATDDEKNAARDVRLARAQLTGIAECKLCGNDANLRDYYITKDGYSICESCFEHGTWKRSEIRFLPHDHPWNKWW